MTVTVATVTMNCAVDYAKRGALNSWHGIGTL